MEFQEPIFDSKDILKIIGKNIYFARMQKNLTITELSAATGYDRHNLSDLENGDQNIKYNTLVKIARALDAPFPALFSRNFETLFEEGFKEDNYLQVFIENFRQAMAQKGRNMGSIYPRTGVDHSSLSRIISKKGRGKKHNNNPTVTTLYAMASTAEKDMYPMFLRTKGGD